MQGRQVVQGVLNAELLAHVLCANAMDYARPHINELARPSPAPREYCIKEVQANPKE